MSLALSVCVNAGRRICSLAVFGVVTEWFRLTQ